MQLFKKSAAVLAALVCTATVPAFSSSVPDKAAAADISSEMTWDTLKIGGAGFVSSIIAGQNTMYMRTDVGGAYKYDYTRKRWVQLLDFINDNDRGYLAVKGIAIDPTDDDIAYFLCGCAYFSGARTAVFKTTDGGESFTEVDVTDMIQVHGNGDGRECTEPIAIDPDDPNTIYCGGDVTAGDSALIKSTDGGATWTSVKSYDDLGMYTNSVKYPTWTDHMVRGTSSGAYNEQNGIASIRILDGKVYVATSVTGQTNIHVANVSDDKFTELSADLPTENYPVSISYDGADSLFFTYIAGLAFQGGAGGVFKYDLKTGKVTDISPTKNAFGMVFADKDDPDKLVTRTCGVWSDQWFEEEWTDGSIAWGDHFFRSTDGGETWQDITPGQQVGQYSDNHYFVSLPIDTNGYDWIYGKACHWGSSIVIDPRDPDKILLSSGNGVYACDNVWDEKGIQFYFDPNGIEECVSLDFVSVPGGYNYSAIGDYDGFVHKDFTSTPPQYQPNIGSTSAIAYCPSDTKVMARVGENEAKGYYSLDAGETWTDLNCPNGGGKLAITQLSSGKYRFFKASKDNASLQYTDDFGKTWNDATGVKGSSTAYTLVDPTDPSRVYAYCYNYNAYWASNPALTEPSFDEAHYSVFFSDDYGATFTENQICRYDMCDHCGDLAFVSEDTVMAAAGWYGIYKMTENCTKAEKLDVYYAKTLGYGAPEKSGGPNTLFMYGKPAETDVEGIYRSTDGGETWDCINTEHLYGGTGNGNYLVGDMNEFGTVYMSTVGCGIVYGRLTKNISDEPTTEPTTKAGVIYGDANGDNDVTVADATLIMQAAANPDEYSVKAENKANADCENVGDGVTVSDALAIQQYLNGKITSLPV